MHLYIYTYILHIVFKLYMYMRICTYVYMYIYVICMFILGRSDFYDMGFGTGVLKQAVSGPLREVCVAYTFRRSQRLL